jgi:signal transduction histidine kinase
MGIGVPQIDFWYLVVLLFGGYCILTGVSLMLIHFKKTKDPQQKRQDLIMLSSMLFAGLLVLFFSFSTSEFSQSVVGQHILPVACLIAMSSFFYVMYRGLFDIHFFVIRALAYITTLFLLTAFFITPAAIFITAENVHITHENLPWAIAIAVVLLYILQFLRAVFDRVTSRLFFRHFYNPQDVLDRLSGVLARTIDLSVLRRNSTRVIADTLKPNFVRFLLQGSTSQKAKNIFPILEKLHFNKSNVQVLERRDYTDNKFKALKDERIAVVVRLRTADEFIGYMILGFKRSGEVYNDRDVRLLNTAADELALAIQNAKRFEKISRFNETLQQEINQATEELRTSNKKLKALDEAKDEFISMASHQLRTPLTSVKGYVSMVLEGDAGKLTDDQRKLLQEAYASSQRMVYMIADFLNVSRLRTGKFILEPSSVQLDMLVKEEVSQLQAAAKGRGLTIKTHFPAEFPTLQLDENKIRQVIMNFIDNAIFYSKSGGTVTVSLTKDNKQFTFTVEDTGIGVPAGEQSQVFGKFFRASNAIHVRPDGTGIGLFMAKKVIAAHGGEMIFKSQEGKGSTFGFSLPLKLHNKTDSLKK